MPKHICKKTEKGMEEVGILPSLTEWNRKFNKSGGTITGKLTVQSGDGSGCLQIGADVASNTLTAGTRKLARMTFPTREYGTTKTCSIMSCDNNNNYNYVEFGGHIGDATNTAPDYMCFNVDKTHNSLSPATKECVMAISPTSLRLFNGVLDAGRITSFDSISGKWVFNNSNTFKNSGYTYTLPDKGGTIALKGDIPTSLKNPNALTFGEKIYDGSSAQTITLADLGGQAKGNYAILGSNGKLDDSVIPAVAITDTYVVATKSAMLALDAQKGDIAIRSDLNKSFVLQATPASTPENWKELLTPTDAVLSVNSKKGAVTLNLDDIKDGSDRKLANYIPKSVLTTKGDIIYASAASTSARLGIGSNGQFLSIANGIPKWVNNPNTDTNTSHSHSVGIGLVGSGSAGTGGGTYTYKAKLRSETALTVDSAAATTSGKVYPVAVDKSGYLSLNVPLAGFEDILKGIKGRTQVEWNALNAGEYGSNSTYNGATLPPVILENNSGGFWNSASGRPLDISFHFTKKEKITTLQVKCPPYGGVNPTMTVYYAQKGDTELTLYKEIATISTGDRKAYEFNEEGISADYWVVRFTSSGWVDLRLCSPSGLFTTGLYTEECHQQIMDRFNGYQPAGNYALKSEIIAKSLTSVKGDMIYASAANTPARLAIGSTGQFLSVDNGIPKWVNNPNSDTHYTNYLQIKGDGAEAVKFTQNADKTLNLKHGNNVSISVASGEITISATVPTKSSWNYDDTYVKYSAAQSLTDNQKAQARKNIGAGTITEIKVNGTSKGTSGSVDLTNMVTFASSQTATVAGTSKTTYTYNQPTGDSNTGSSNGSAYFPEGIIMGGTAASAGLVTRGICGVNTPDATTGACNKENLYINYDGNNTYQSNRQLVLQAGTVGTHYGYNLYEYAAARGDAVKNYCDATYAKKSDVQSSLNSKADLDSNGKVPSSQLPSYVDDVEEYTSQSSFPATGTTGKIYVDTTTNLTFRWSGTEYVVISPSLALGETSSTAYAGNKGADNAKNIQTILGYFDSDGKAKTAITAISAIDDKNGRDITATYVNKTVTSTESMAGSLSVAGSLTSPYIATGNTASSYFQSQKFRGEGNASTYYHAVDFGFANHNQVDFYEYGGIWNFWKNQNSTPTTDSNNLCLQIGDTYVKNKGNTFKWPTTSGTVALKEDIPTEATAADNILHGSNKGTQITYAPYAAQQSKLSFDTSTTAPTRTDRLNLNGYLYATKFNVAGKAAVQYNSTEDCIEFIFA